MAEMRGIRLDEKNGGGYIWAVGCDSFHIHGSLEAGIDDAATVRNLGDALAQVFATGTVIIPAMNGTHGHLIPNHPHRTIQQLQEYSV